MKTYIIRVDETLARYFEIEAADAQAAQDDFWAGKPAKAVAADIMGHKLVSVEEKVSVPRNEE